MELIGWLMVLLMCISGWLQYQRSKAQASNLRVDINLHLKQRHVFRVLQGFAQGVAEAPKPAPVNRQPRKVRNYDDPPPRSVTTE